MAFFEADNLRVELHDGVALLWLDVKGRGLNVLGKQTLADLDAALDACVSRSEKPRLLVISSAKPTGFLAGADVRELAQTASPQAAAATSERGQKLFDKLESLPIPSVAVVQGPCLGGGLELALACDARVAIDHPKTQFGLPEIKLGLLPAWGGTQRLPRVVGLERALQIILAQKTLGAAEALRWGLADAVVPAGADARAVVLGAAALVRAEKRPRTKLPSRTWRQKLLESTGVGRAILFRGAEAILRRKTPDDMPAPAEALAAIRVGVAKGTSAGLAREREGVARLMTTPACRNLMALFFEHEAAKQMPAELADVPVKKVRKVAVVGAGTMGAGIAQLAAVKGFEVVVREVNEMALGVGLMTIAGLFETAVRRGVLSRHEAERRTAAIKGTVAWDGFADADVVVEAVIEDLDLKRRVFRDLEAHTRPDAVLATNTSSLGIARVQEGLTHPGRVAALHFFNPVHKMPLVEVGHAAATSREAAAVLTRLALDLGKTPVVVKDSPGFVVNRVLIPYLNEAVLLVAEGMAVPQVDEAMKRFGMLMGPLEVIDEIGLDVAAHVARTAQPLFAERFPPNPVFDALCKNGWLGRKSGAGFYRHSGKNKSVNAAAVAAARAAGAAGASLLAALPPAARLREARERMTLLMLNEAAAAVGEGLVAHPDLIDRAMVFGSGWAPHRGGPLRYVDDRGAADVVQALSGFAQRLGPRFEPCAELRRRAAARLPFRTPLPAGAAAST